MTLKPWCILLFTVAVCVPAAAEVVIAECEDEDGSVSYRDRCPPGSQQVGSRALGGRRAPDQLPSAEELAALYPVTLYRVPACDTCDLLRLILQDRGIPFAEIDVEQVPEAQSELKTLSGTARVPTVTVGKEVIAGFDRVLLQQTLDAVGYPSARPSSAPR